MLDPISDMLTRIRNAQRAGHSEVVFPNSKFKKAVMKVFHNKNFIDGIEVIDGKSFDLIKVYLKYYKNESSLKVVPAIKQIKQVSKNGQRIYANRGKIRKVKNGRGIAVISTSKGVMSGEDAYKQGIGGELICEVW